MHVGGLGLAFGALLAQPVIAGAFDQFGILVTLLLVTAGLVLIAKSM